MSDAGGWIIASATRIGTRRQAAGLNCQDHATIKLTKSPNGAETLIIAVSDGAGSAPRSEEGAHTATTRFESFVVDALAGREGRPDERLARDAARAARQAVLAICEDQSARPRDFACTLMGAIVAPDGACFAQIGDGVIALRTSQGLWRPAVWPHRGEYANETYFLTDDDAETRLETFIVSEAVENLAIATDALQEQVIDAASRSIAERFLDPLFAAMRDSRPEDREPLSQALGRFLDSDPVNAHTDDDKTLVLATPFPSRAVPSSDLIAV